MVFTFYARRDWYHVVRAYLSILVLIETQASYCKRAVVPEGLACAWVLAPKLHLHQTQYPTRIFVNFIWGALGNLAVVTMVW